MSVDERVELAGIPLRNAVLTASGTFGYGTEFSPFLDLEKIGGFVAKSLTLEPRFGNPPPRIGETPSGMLNAISIENVGVKAFLEEKLPALPEGVVVIASAFGTAPEQYAELASRVSPHPRIAGIEHPAKRSFETVVISRAFAFAFAFTFPTCSHVPLEVI